MVIQRTAVRAIILSSGSNLLLLQQIENPEEGGRLWLLPGGGVNQDENTLEALKRELIEETGQEIHSFTGPIWQGTCGYKYKGVDYRQKEYFFIARVPQFEILSVCNPDSTESALHRSWRWWSLQEIINSNDVFSPRRLGIYLSSLLNNEENKHVEISFND